MKEEEAYNQQSNLLKTPPVRSLWSLVTPVFSIGVLLFLTELLLLHRPESGGQAATFQQRLLDASILWLTVIPCLGLLFYWQRTRTREQWREAQRALAAAVDETQRLDGLLSQRRQQLLALAQNQDEALLLVDDDGSIRFSNPAAQRLFAFSAEEHPALQFSQITDCPLTSADFSADLPALGADSGELGAGTIRSGWASRLDGSRFGVQFRLWRLDLAGSPQALLLARNLTESPIDPQGRLEFLDRLNGLSQRLQADAASLSRQQIGRLALEDCTSLEGVAAAWIGCARPDGAIEVACSSAAVPRAVLHQTQQWDAPSEELGLCGMTIRTGQPHLVELTPEAEPDSPALSGPTPPLRSAAAVPLIGCGRTLGALNLYSPIPDWFTEERIEFFRTYACLLASSLERDRLQEAETRSARHRVALREIDMAITARQGVEKTLDVILDNVIGQLQVDAAAILLLERDSLVFEYALNRGFHTDALRHTRLRFGEGAAGRAANERRVVHIPDLGCEPNGFSRSPLLQHEGFKSYWAVPLISKGEVKGILEVFRRSRAASNPEWDEFMQNLSAQAALAIDYSELLSNLQQSNLDLMLAYDDTLEGWARALELRDFETEGHSRRVTELTDRLARVLHLDEAQRVAIRRGALLHDIGKIGIPDSILLKPGPPTPEEWRVIRRHPTLAYEMLRPISFLHASLDIPYCHHERWDGAGYPRGLKGEQIPLAARLFAVVDVWDALISNRPYSKAWSQEKAREYLRDNAGTHFDPRMVEAFLGLLDEIAQSAQLPPTYPTGPNEVGQEA